MRNLILIISLLFISCSEQSEVEESKEYSAKSELTKSILKSLGELSEYKQNGFVLYCKKDSYSDRNKDYLLTQIDDAVSRVKQVLEIDELPRSFNLIMLNSREEMGSIFGNNYKGLSIKEDKLALFVFTPEIRPYFRHELFHLVSYQVWGDTKTRLLNEGGAMYTDNTCLNYHNPILVINKYLYENNMWFDFEELINNFREKASENDMITYLESAYIFKYLYENYGKEKMQELWQRGFSELESIYGFDLMQLEREIGEELQNTKYQEVDWQELMEKGCG